MWARKTDALFFWGGEREGMLILIVRELNLNGGCATVWGPHGIRGCTTVKEYHPTIYCSFCCFFCHLCSAQFDKSLSRQDGGCIIFFWGKAYPSYRYRY